MPNKKNALLYFQQILSLLLFRNSYPKIEINTINKNNNNLKSSKISIIEQIL